MKTNLLALGLIVAGVLLVPDAPAVAQLPINAGGAPVFRAAQFSANGPQPFSTRRGRELQAARNRGVITTGIFRGSSSNYRRSSTTFQRSRSSGIFSRRSFRFR